MESSYIEPYSFLRLSLSMSFSISSAAVPEMLVSGVRRSWDIEICP